MQPFPHALRSILAVLWIGAMWTVGVLVAPVLFHYLPNGEAGRIAGILFRGVAWVGIVAGAYLVLHALWQEGLKAFQTADFWLVLGMLTLTLVNQFAIFPIIDDIKPHMHAAAEGLFGGGFQSWHTISSLIYLVQAVLGLFYVGRGAA